MTDTKRIADKVAKRFQTRNPFEIAESLGFDIVYVPLAGIRGFYQQLKRNKFIYIRNDLCERDALLVCAHELGHWFQHRTLNRVFMDTQTHFVTSKYEAEANKFAACLLYTDDFLEDLIQCSTDHVIAVTGLPHPIAKWRMEQIVK